jgi:hypothetical protein
VGSGVSRIRSSASCRGIRLQPDSVVCELSWDPASAGFSRPRAVVGSGVSRIRSSASCRGIRLQPDLSGCRIRLKADPTYGRAWKIVRASCRGIRLQPDFVRASRRGIRLQPDSVVRELSWDPASAGLSGRRIRLKADPTYGRAWEIVRASCRGIRRQPDSVGLSNPPEGGSHVRKGVGDREGELSWDPASAGFSRPRAVVGSGFSRIRSSASCRGIRRQPDLSGCRIRLKADPTWIPRTEGRKSVGDREGESSWDPASARFGRPRAVVGSGFSRIPPRSM